MKTDEIPTAEEWIKFYEENAYPGTSLSQAMIEFAKLHVTAALEEATENLRFIETTSEELNSEEYKPFITADDDTIWTIDKQSILNSYPLTNIK